MTRQLSLAALTLADLPPPDFIRIAQDAGCTGVSISAGVSTKVETKSGSVVNDAKLRRETAKALAETGMRLDLVEGLAIQGEIDRARVREALSVMHDLGGHLVNILIFDEDIERRSNSLENFCDIATRVGFGVTLEFAPLSNIKTLDDALPLVQSDRYQNLRLLLDPLHMARADVKPREIAALPPELIGLAQLCDGANRWPGMDAYWSEALYDREIPGEGEFPLREFMDALPSDMILSIEVPMRRLEREGMTPLEIARKVTEGARAIQRISHSD